MTVKVDIISITLQNLKNHKRTIDKIHKDS